jgi:two-component system, cell cycle sensor histidine kinase and response regulator CckA
MTVPLTRTPSATGTIMIVDDEPMVRLVVGRLLEEWDFRVLEADNGATALRVAREFEGTLSLVITDLVMPYMDGCEFANVFRPLYPDVPILFMTGKCPNALIGSFFDPRENLVFKPFDSDTFLDVVARVLESHINHGRVSA